MPEFSGRYWNTLQAQDRRLTKSLQAYEHALRRYSASQRAVTPGSRDDFLLELCESVAELRAVLRDLSQLIDRHDRLAASKIPAARRN